MENPQEVKELRNKLRMMKFPQDEILNTVRKQQRAIDKQKQANDTIKMQIQKYEEEIEGYEKTILAYKSSEERQNLVAKKKNLTNKLGILQADFKAEDDKRRRLEEQVSKARSKAGGMFAQAKENENIQFKVHTVENRLDQALNAYNKQLQKLEASRTQIDELLQERRNFDEVYGILDKEQTRNADNIASLIDQSNKSYTIRDQKKIDLVILQKEEKQDQAEDEAELNRLNQMIEGQSLLAMHPHTEQQPIPSLSSQSTNQTDQQEELQKEIDTRSALVNQIITENKCQKLDELFNKLSDLETENYSLFNFVVQRGAEKSSIIDEIDALTQRSGELDANVELTDEQQNAKLKVLAENMEKTEKQIAELSDVKDSNDKSIKSVYDGLEDLYKELDLPWDNSPDEKKHVTPLNAMFCLTQIENKLAEFMDEVLSKTASISVDSREFSSGGDKRITSQRSILIPNASKVFDVGADARNGSEKDLLSGVSKPLSVEEMRAKVGLKLN
ncbi:hypothetical protein TVAG_120000 [Trichomonas vaginalis G3]|uniref:ODAD1 central coiled coil region domain-containing protein n=1 Tax=Trichomonas vaginalis (strain ATCC PRA-98 / G3) TaxID=412133 RepID=A2D7E6_TRIV3|nr:coiled-coil domain-containing protein 63 family [Trichomonas vaginalis G3]EAY23663.1 hypothetical protein TVAG_120000 [Trichomonas vaginalis G3]KAI5490155.1 coiled-coil domain-containing protein 63 family [Trichomonas vaginalis G3]|eukprot:XP_001276911.1 hypothetical protein [Trichomonas vaginalis G3]